jgi:hypothetical protein
MLRLAPAVAAFFLADWTWRVLHDSEPLLRDVAAWAIFAAGVAATIALLARHLLANRTK